MKPSVGSFIVSGLLAGMSIGFHRIPDSVPLAILSGIAFVFAIVLDHNEV